MNHHLFFGGSSCYILLSIEMEMLFHHIEHLIVVTYLSYQILSVNFECLVKSFS